MRITVTVQPQSGADVTVVVERPEPRTITESRDFSPALVGECLDTAVERVRSACGIEAS